jgi:hypothetical protein
LYRRALLDIEQIHIVSRYDSITKRSASPSAQASPRPKFPGAQQYAEHVYQSEMVHRDNSSFSANFTEHQSLVLTQAMQLWKNNTPFPRRTGV